jgi:hypothetical protein
MREFFGWIRWVWTKQETWQKLWIMAMFFMGMALAAEGWAKVILATVPVCVFSFYLTKWMVWDVFQASWAKYREHRNELLTTIKTSDKE